jgi:anti-sigma regulatory factor (Ser/Thr protein kinase)
MTHTTFESELPRSPEAPWMARRCLTAWFGDELELAEMNVAKLLTSELVTNAVLHGKGTIVLHAGMDAGLLLVEVTDEGQGFERFAQRQGYKDLGGRGLAIVDSEASRWGIHPGVTCVWFELDRPGARIATPERSRR